MGSLLTWEFGLHGKEEHAILGAQQVFSSMESSVVLHTAAPQNSASGLATSAFASGQEKNSQASRGSQQVSSSFV